MKHVLAVGIVCLMMQSFNLYSQQRAPLTACQGCSFDEAPDSVEIIYLFDASQDVLNMVEEICATVGLKPNFNTYAANVEYAVSTMRDGMREIWYDETFYQEITQSTSSRWAFLSVLAHEIGHHLNGHNLTCSEGRPPEELEADEFSGFTCGRLGSTLVEAQTAMTMLKFSASSTHPDYKARLAAIAVGWRKGTSARNERAATEPVGRTLDEGSMRGGSSTPPNSAVSQPIRTTPSSTFREGGSYESAMKALAESIHSSLIGTENKTVLVSSFSRMEGKGCNLAETVTGDFEEEFHHLPRNFKMLNRAVLDQYAKEHKLQMDGQIDDEQKMKEAGKLLKADIMIFGSYRFIGKNLVLRVHADDIQTSEQLAILSLTCVPSKTLKQSCDEAGSGPAISRDRPSSGAPGTRSEPGGGSNSSPNTTTPAVPCGSQVGDYCFENRSAKEMTVRLHGNRMMATTIMVSPGGSECFLGIAVGVYTYQVEYRDSRPPYRHNGPGGNIRIEPCKSGTYTYR